MGKGAVYAFLGPFATNDKMAQKREGVDKMLSHFFTPSFIFTEARQQGIFFGWIAVGYGRRTEHMLK